MDEKNEWETPDDDSEEYVNNDKQENPLATPSQELFAKVFIYICDIVTNAVENISNKHKK